MSILHFCLPSVTEKLLLHTMCAQAYHRHLPHLQPDGAVLFITFRVQGSLPDSVLARIQAMRVNLQAAINAGLELPDEIIAHQKRIFAVYDSGLDSTCFDISHQSCIFRRPRNAQAMVDKIIHGTHLQKFILHRFCVMPNHVHLLLEPQTYKVPKCLDLTPRFPPAGKALQGYKAADNADTDRWFIPIDLIMKGLKGSAARAINKISGSSGSIFQQESFDHYVRSPEEYERIIDYIDINPVKARLCKHPEQWPWSTVGKLQNM